jgi:predicted dinucleotide-binding enzyme
MATRIALLGTGKMGSELARRLAAADIGAMAEFYRRR